MYIAIGHTQNSFDNSEGSLAETYCNTKQDQFNIMELAWLVIESSHMLLQNSEVVT